MDETHKKERLAIVGGVVLAVLLLVFGMYSFLRQMTTPGSAPTATDQGSATQPVVQPTREAVSPDVVVPEKGDTNVAAGVATPDVTAPANPQNSGTYRKFTMDITNNAFFPKTFIVTQGDTVHIDVTAIDAAYDVLQPDYGFGTALKKGETKFLEFSATGAGQFTFYCTSCGGPAKGPTGTLIVKPKS